MAHIAKRGRRALLLITAISVTLQLTPALASRQARGRDLTHRGGTIWSRTMQLRDGDRGRASTMTWKEAAQRSSSPESICSTVKSRVSYSRDTCPEDEWRSGKATWSRGRGDCEDYAAVVKELCREKGFEAQTFVLRSKTAGEAHAVTVGERNGRVWVSSNGSYTVHRSLFDAKQEIARDQGWWAPEVEMFRVEQSTQTPGERRYVKTAGATRRAQGKH